jgi:hypothetical protein
MSQRGQLGLAKAAVQRVAQMDMETRPGPGLREEKQTKKRPECPAAHSNKV